MRIETSKFDKENGIGRWDEFPERDPRITCFSCGFFTLEIAQCSNKDKQFKERFLTKETDRSIFHYKVMRCSLHKLDRKVERNLNSPLAALTDEQIRAKKREVEDELDTLKDQEEARRMFGGFFHKPIRVDGSENEIDVDIYTKESKMSFTNFIDDIDPTSIKILNTTFWIWGFKRKHAPMIHQVHHSLGEDAPLQREKHIFKKERVIKIVFHKNGRSVEAAGSLWLSLLSDLTGLDTLLNKIDQSKVIMETVRFVLDGLNVRVEFKDHNKTPNRIDKGMIIYRFSINLSWRMVIVDLFIEPKTTDGVFDLRLDYVSGVANSGEFNTLRSHVKGKLDLLRPEGLTLTMTHPPNDW